MPTPLSKIGAAFSSDSEVHTVYSIARIARTKLLHQASKEEHCLRLLVAHANLLDVSMDMLHSYDSGVAGEADLDLDQLEHIYSRPVKKEEEEEEGVEEAFVDSDEDDLTDNEQNDHDSDVGDYEAIESLCESLRLNLVRTSSEGAPDARSSTWSLRDGEELARVPTGEWKPVLTTIHEEMVH